MKRKGKKKGKMFFNLKYFVLHKICSILQYKVHVLWMISIKSPI